MFAFPKPRYLAKRVNPLTQKTEPSYQFDVHMNGSIEESPICMILDSISCFTVKVLEEELKEQQKWWEGFLQSFLATTNQYFSRPYTVSHLQRILQHLCHSSMTGNQQHNQPDVPVYVYSVPYILELIGGKLLVHWKYDVSPAKIHIPDEEEEDKVLAPLPVLKASQGGLEEWDIESVPEEKNATDESSFGSMNPAMLLERQRVKEARLKAKVAMYRAQMEMNRYYDKYGDDISDSDSESESDEENEEEDNVEEE